MPKSRHWFVSDTHFCAHRLEHVNAFEKLCTLFEAGDTLLLLGDIFEIWVSDDLAEDIELRIEKSLKSCVDRGVTVYFMHGNRDFMIGQTFAKRTGVKLLADPSIWALPNDKKVLLTHGDWFCTDDKKYRRYRRVVRNKLFQFCFRFLPRKTKLNIAHSIRQKSIQAHQTQGNQSYDANGGLIEQYFQKYSPTDTIIMGHTHLPNLHTDGSRHRLVLGDWRGTIWYGVASEESGFALYEASLDLANRRLAHRFD